MLQQSTHAYWLKFIFIIVPLFFITDFSYAQILSRIFKIDTTSRGFYEVLDSITNNRVYLSERLTSPTLISKKDDQKINYRSNGNTNIGVGHTYEWLTINIGVNLKFLNDDEDTKGETRLLDLHTQIIGRPFIINLYGQFYRGVYLLPDSGKNAPGIPYEQRPDIRTRLIGGSVYFVPNWRRFSFAAAVTQRDWQKKSAGSPLYGVEFFWGSMRGDSSLIPKNELGSFERRDIQNLGFIEAAAGIGYGYTLVIKKNWFVHASATAGLATGYFLERTPELQNRGSIYVLPNMLVRAAVGYNSRTFNAAAYFFGNRNTAGNDQLNMMINVSNLRLTLAYRLVQGPKLAKRYDKLLKLNPTWKKIPAAE
jgi:hypothetical protein